jgi:hypothetical protein
LTEKNAERTSIFAFGGGRTVNQYMLDLLAYRNKGESYVTDQIDSIKSDLPDFFGELSDPILVECRTDYGSIDEDSVFPKQIPDFYKGRAVTVYGRFDPRNDREFAMRLTGRAGDRKKEVVFKADLSKAASGNADIAKEWAFRKIYYLIGETCRLGETPQLLEERRALSQKYDIKTSYDN